MHLFFSPPNSFTCSLQAPHPGKQSDETNHVRGRRNPSNPKRGPLVQYTKHRLSISCSQTDKHHALHSFGTTSAKPKGASRRPGHPGSPISPSKLTYNKDAMHGTISTVGGNIEVLLSDYHQHQAGQPSGNEVSVHQRLSLLGVPGSHTSSVENLTLSKLECQNNVLWPFLRPTTS